MELVLRQSRVVSPGRKRVFLMEDIGYSRFSLNSHGNHIRRGIPSVCQFELTFACPFHCSYCYTDCYNRPALLKKQMRTAQVRETLDTLAEAGVAWICFTGGDPCSRADFPAIYGYAKRKGFIVTIFSTGISMSRDMVSLLSAEPPFVVELTLNAVSEKLFERIAGVKGAYRRTLEGIERLSKAGIPLKIKTMFLKENFDEVRAISRFVSGIGQRLRLIPIIHPRLDGDTAPLRSRLPVSVLKRLGIRGRAGCGGANPDRPDGIFTCDALRGDAVFLDPAGNMSLCYLLRDTRYNILRQPFKEAVAAMRASVSDARFTTRSSCRSCAKRGACTWCPGRAFLATGSLERRLAYDCLLCSNTNQRK